MKRLRYLRIGIISGVQAGCLSSSFFIVIIFTVLPLVFIIFDNTFPFGFDDLPYYLIMMPFVAFIAGVFPSILIGALLGCLFGLSFPYLKDNFVNKTALLLISAFFGLVIALPLITTWEAFLRSTPDSGILLGKEVALVFSPFCLAAGIYVGRKLDSVANQTDT